MRSHQHSHQLVCTDLAARRQGPLLCLQAGCCVRTLSVSALQSELGALHMQGLA